MSISGHVTRSVFDRYNISSTDDTLAALKQQGEFLKNRPKSNVVTCRTSDTDKTRTTGR